ncbi:MAG: hypothetical protein Alpg2KO_18410 [Alphaproteobacteria bacterium]
MADQIAQLEEADIHVYQGVDAMIQFEVLGEGDAAIDVTGWVNLQFTVRTEVGATGAPPLHVTTQTQFDKTGNVITLNLSDTDTNLSVSADHSYRAPYQDYRYDMLAEDTEGRTWLLSHGFFRVYQRVAP